MDNSRRQLVRLYLDNLQVQVQDTGYNQVWTDWRELDYTPNYNKFYFICDGKGWLKIGERVGIPDASYLSKLFKSSTGLSPTAYRITQSGGNS